MVALTEFFALGYPHLLPMLRGAPLRAFLATVATDVAVALDVNEAFDDPELPLGSAAYCTLNGHFVSSIFH